MAGEEAEQPKPARFLSAKRLRLSLSPVTISSRSPNILKHPYMSFSFTETKAGAAREFYAQGAVAYDGRSALKIERRAPST